jgi:hypothetical protein
VGRLLCRPDSIITRLIIGHGVQYFTKLALSTVRVSISRHWPPALINFLQNYGIVFSIEYRYPGAGHLLLSTFYKLTVFSFQSSTDIQALDTCLDQLFTNLRYFLFNRVSISRRWTLALINFLQTYGIVFSIAYRYPDAEHLLWSTFYKFTVFSFQSTIDIETLDTCSEQLFTNLQYCLFNRVSISRRWTLALINFLRTDIITQSTNDPGCMPLLINFLIESTTSLNRLRLPAFACLLWSTALYS